VCLLPAAALAQSGIRATKHNLSVTGPGPIKSGTETEVCAPCHTPHNANPVSPPLWNREFSSANYTPYASASLQAAPGQPTGYSKLCLSCHDGTIAIGSVRNLRGQPATIQLNNTGPGDAMPAGSTLIGTTLTNDHPISFVFDQALSSADGELVSPSALTGAVHLWPGTNPSVANEVQCTTCHDPHTSDLPKFLRKSATGQSDNLCLTCHQKPGWTGSTHLTDAFFWPSGQTSTQVRDWSCLACHAPHTVDGAERLLRNGAAGGQSAIEETCYQCHKSSGSGGIAQNVQSEFAKANKHPVTLSPGVHRPVFITRPPAGLPENVLLSPGGSAEDPRFTDQKHVECVDCHNPHRVTASNRTEGMRGIAINAGAVENVVNDPAPADGQSSTRQYPVCLRCHGDTYDRITGTVTLPSGAQPGNKRLQFQTTNSSFHPVAGPGRNTSSNLGAQLTPNGLNVSSVIKCTDCHNSNAYENTAGRAPTTGTTPNQPVGPHGSSYASILRARYWNSLPGPQTWNSANFNLCFRCHSVTALTAEQTGSGARTNFYDTINGKNNLHWVHLIDRIDKSRPRCKDCHYNIHSNVEAPNTQYRIDLTLFQTPPPGTPSRLVNFDPSVRGIGGRPKPEWWFNTTTRERRCYIQCHNPDGTPGGATMNGDPYRPTSGDLP
jgi:predicted CXXCH cytochrome family protein